jgi:hypothetical protein
MEHPSPSGVEVEPGAVSVLSSMVEGPGVAGLWVTCSSAVDAEVEVGVFSVVEATSIPPEIGAFHGVCFWAEGSLVLDLEVLLSCLASGLKTCFSQDALSIIVPGS